MKKPVIIRLFGWVFWLCAALILGSVITWDQLPDTLGKALLPMLMAGTAVFCFIIWLIGTLVAWASHRQAAQTAAIVREIVGTRGQPSFAGQPSTLGTASGAGPAVSLPLCELCGKYAATARCVVHRVAVCGACVVAHVDTTCRFENLLPANPRPATGTQPRKGFRTSPLGLNTGEK